MLQEIVVDSPREIAFHQSANRPHLLLGGDRELVVVSGVLAAIGVTLIFGGEWNEFARRGVFAVCAIALLVGGTVIMTTLFGVSAACV